MRQRLNEYYLGIEQTIGVLKEIQNKTKDIFPISEDCYKNLTFEEKVLIDALLLRVSKLQDLSGRFIFALLLVLGEDVENLSAIDKLNKAEKLGLISSSELWYDLRMLRNQISHDYSLSTKDLVKDLNKIFEYSYAMMDEWNMLKEAYNKLN